MSQKQFAHLHVHSDYSLLDGMSRIEDLVRMAAEDGNPAIALTDHSRKHGGLAGLTDLVKACRKHGIKPIPGAEFYHVPDASIKANVSEGKTNYHLTVLAISNQGLSNLIKLSSIAGTVNRYQEYARVDFDTIRPFSEGLVITSGCIGSMINQALLDGDREKALQAGQEFVEMVGKDRFFVEVADHGIPDQHKIFADQRWLAEELGVGLLAANDSHYDKPEDAETHDALLCAQTGNVVDDPNRFRFSGHGHHFRSAQEMWELFPEKEWPGACANTLKVVEMSSVDVRLGSKEDFLLPKYPTPPEYGSSKEYLKSWTYEGAAELYGNEDGVIPTRVIEQIEYELKVISDAGYTDYTLIIADIIRYARQNNIRTGDGRGSAAGSVVSYCTGITKVDPIKHGLSFERYLNPDRVSMPDIDFDSEPGRREELIRYAVQLFGSERVARVATYGKLKAKAAVKSAARVLSYPVHLGASISAMIPGNTRWTLELAMKPSKRDVPTELARLWTESSALRSEYRDNPDAKKIIDLALQFENVRAQLGVHAGGVLITPSAVDDHIPVVGQSKDDLLLSQLDHDAAESLGGLKFDFLGLTTLEVINGTLALIQSDLGERIDLDRIPIDDPAVFRMMQNDDVDGVFQLSSGGMRDLMRLIQPTKFGDIAALVALFRPGPMGANSHVEYANRKNGRTPITVPHPEMLDLFKDTYGLVIYQEDVMRLVQHYAGYSMKDADTFRRIVGKKDQAAMELEMARFFESVQGQGYSKDTAQTLWDIIGPFVDYAFNKSHSVAYGMISYKTAWLKAHYPAQFAAAGIDFASSTNIPAQVASARAQGIEIYPPDVNLSNRIARTDVRSIWMGMSRIKHVGQLADTVIRVRESGGKFTSLGDFLKRVFASGAKANANAIESLIRVGGFDELHGSRKAMVEQLPSMIEDAKAEVKAEHSSMGLGGLFDDVDLETRLDGYDLEGEDYTPSERSRIELDLLGFFLGAHPFKEYERYIDGLRSSGQIPEHATTPGELVEPSDQKQVDLYGVLSGFTNRTSKSRKPYATFTLETNAESKIEGTVFGRHLSENDISSLVLVRGKLQEDVGSRQSDEGDQEEVTEWKVIASELEKIRIDRSPRSRRSQFSVIQGERGRKRRNPAVVTEVPEKDGTADDPVSPEDVAVSEVSESVASADSESTEGVVFIFDVEGEKKLTTLAGALQERGPGTTPVLIRYQGQLVTDENLRFHFPNGRLSARRIATSVGVTVEERLLDER